MSKGRRLHEDPGLQPERTTLAWTRTAVSLMVASAVLLRWSSYYPVVVYGSIFLMVTLALLIYLTQRKRYRRSGYSLAREQLSANLNSVLILTVAMLLLGISGMIMVIR